MSWIEVESKIRVHDVNQARKRIREIAKFVKIENKVDDYYSLKHDVYPKRSLRIRRKGKKVEVNFKQWLSYVNGVHAKREVEFEVSDLKGFFDLLDDFGFKKWLSKEKRTELYKTRDGTKIELNHVKGLGWFIEIEILCQPKNIASARKRIMNIRRKLALPRKDIPRKDIKKIGYTKDLWNLRKR
ncbi:MAG: class IV adenylate cyclase [Nanoarchaeota archaeon]|nr:class IV adenylate cyclase [Nanoarchaeota archaeon]